MFLALPFPPRAGISRRELMTGGKVTVLGPRGPLRDVLDGNECALKQRF